MPGPVLFVPNSGQHLRKIAIYVLNNLLTLMSNDDHNMARLRIQNRGQHVTEGAADPESGAEPWRGPTSSASHASGQNQQPDRADLTFVSRLCIHRPRIARMSLALRVNNFTALARNVGSPRTRTLE